LSKFLELNRIKELEAKAKRPRIAERRAGISSYMREALPNAAIVDTDESIFAFGEDIAAFLKETDADHYVALRNAAPWLLRIAEAFQPGDSKLLREAIYDVIDTEKNGEKADKIIDCLRRLQKAAEEMER
jgi:hypothetical protein